MGLGEKWVTKHSQPFFMPYQRNISNSWLFFVVAFVPNMRNGYSDSRKMYFLPIENNPKLSARKQPNKLCSVMSCQILFPTIIITNLYYFRFSYFFIGTRNGFFDSLRREAAHFLTRYTRNIFRISALCFDRCVNIVVSVFLHFTSANRETFVLFTQSFASVYSSVLLASFILS